MPALRHTIGTHLKSKGQLTALLVLRAELEKGQR